MDVRLLGELECFADDAEPLAVRGVKARTLLAVLALHRGEPVATDRLIDIVWGEEPPGKPANALQALVVALRRAIGADKVVTTDAGYALSATPEEIDVVRFEALVAEGCRHLESGDATLASETLGDALALCRGEPLVEFAYAEFATGERVRLDELRLVAIEARLDADLALGRHAERVAELESLCDAHPLRERLWELRMLALYRSGRQADALRVYATARDGLIDALGLEPGPALRALEGRILAQDPTLDLATARPTGQATAPVGNLRQRLTSFVGRDEAVARVGACFESSRLVTLLGPGGAGKTRLAVEAAATLQADLPDGAWLVELAGIGDPDGVTAAVATALRVARAEGMTSPVDQIVSHLRDKTLVLVLDNCEHLIGEAAAIAETLLGQLPELRVIATSREALGVPGETLFPVPGLALDASVAVFADRAAAVRPGFAVDDTTRGIVEDVCRRLDGLPLALELAAARLRSLPLTQLAELLDDRFRVLTGGARTALPRQQTLRAVVDWSYDLLFEDERRLAARLGVFAGGWTLEAAEAVCSDELLPPTDIVDLVLHLVDKSLVVADFDADGDARYSQLQTLRHYALERLAESGEGAAMRARHAQWYLAVARGARQGLRGGTGPAWRTRLLTEWENVRAALDWFIETGDADSALDLTESVAWLWFLQGDPHEGARWLDDALEVPGAGAHARAGSVMWSVYFRAWLPFPGDTMSDLHAAIDDLRSSPRRDQLTDALLVAAELHTRQNEVEQSLASLAEARAVLEETGDEWGLATHDHLLARSLANCGRLEQAEASGRASVERYRAIGEQWIILEALGTLAIVSEARGDLETAATTYAELLELARIGGLPNYETLWNARLAGVRARQGNDEDALALFADVRTTAVLPVNIAWSLIGRAGASRRLGDAATARRFLDEAIELCDSLGLDVGSIATRTALCWWAVGTGDLDAAEAFAAGACERSAESPSARMTLAARIAAAAVTSVQSGSPEDRATFDGLVADRNSRGAGGYDGLQGGSLGEYFDEADVMAFIRDRS